MLVLSRKKLEKVWVGRGVRITVVEIGKGKVRIGIDAPEDVNVAREELIPEEDLRKMEHDLEEAKRRRR